MSDANQNRLDFIRNVLRSAPAGQFNAMLEDIQTLAGAPLEQELLEEIQRQHERQTCTNSESASESAHPLTASLKEQLQRGRDEDDAATATSTTRRDIILAPDDNDAQVLLLRTYAERIDEAKCRTGYWTAEWTIRSAPGSSQAEISGHVSLCAFSFEDGNNLQLRSTQDFPVTTVVDASESSTGVLAASIVQHMAHREDQVRASLRDSYATSSHQLKSIRGILPMTRTRLNWNVVTQRTVRNLQETVNK